MKTREIPFVGPDFTLIICDPRTDNVQWFRIFDNSRRVHLTEEQRDAL